MAALEGTTDMIDVPMIGLHGRKNSGKDTVYERILALGGPTYHRFSVADPMKDSISMLLDIDLEALDVLKNDPLSSVEVYSGAGFIQSDQTMRRFMERYGTEAHRDRFGDDFWLDLWLKEAEQRRGLAAELGHGLVVVNTSVRFENEAQAIRDSGGVVWRIVGTPEVEAASALREDGTPIPSEIPLPDHLVDDVIDNAHRSVAHSSGGYGMANRETPDFSHLDDQIAILLSGGKLS